MPHLWEVPSGRSGANLARALGNLVFLEAGVLGRIIPRTDSGILYAQYMEVVRDEERKIGRQLLPSELDRFAREYHAPEYSAEVRRLMALGTRSRTRMSSG